MVTGAGQGSGRAIALTLAANGARVAVNDFDGDRVDAVVAEIARPGGFAIALVADVGDLVAVRSGIETIATSLGPISILINNAGNGGPAGSRPNGRFSGTAIPRGGTASCRSIIWRDELLSCRPARHDRAEVGARRDDRVGSRTNAGSAPLGLRAASQPMRHASGRRPTASPSGRWHRVRRTGRTLRTILSATRSDAPDAGRRDRP